MLKLAIIIILIALLISLFAGYGFLLKDKGGTKRTMYALGIRVSLAITLIALLVYGISTGQLKSEAPWDKKLLEQATKTHNEKNHFKN